ncbi:MAG: hypothetical protein GYA23_01880 [Methanomicrobiales archaeon]|nr:hypothetical protein [Methanomicrobiales archaeon]
MGSFKQQNYGFLSDRRRKYLLLDSQDKNEYLAGLRDDSEREKQKNVWKQDDKHIKNHARQSLKDLILVVNSYPDKETRKIFTISLVKMLIQGIINKQGMDNTEYGPYFQALIKEIEAEINQSGWNSGQEYLCTITVQPKANTGGRPPDFLHEMSGVDRAHWWGKIQNPYKDLPEDELRRLNQLKEMGLGSITLADPTAFRETYRKRIKKIDNNSEDLDG